MSAVATAPVLPPRPRNVGIVFAALLIVFSACVSSHAQDGSPEQLKRLTIEELLSLEVTAVSRVPGPLSQAPSAVQVITGQQIQRSTATSLPEALRLATNLQIGRKNAHDWGISARGFNAELANKLLVLIDGRAVYTPLWSGVRWDVQDVLLEDVDHIEVISGPGGSLWGANAVNGTISVTTKSARQTQGLFVAAGLGDQLERFGAVRYGQEIARDVFARVYFKEFRRDDEFLATGGRAGDASQLAQTGFRADAEFHGGSTLTLQGDYYHGHEGVVGSGEGEVAGGNVIARWSQALANGSDFQLQVYYDRARLELPTAAGPLGAAGRFVDHLQTYDLDFQQRFALGSSQVVVWGAGYRQIHDNSAAAPSLGFEPANVKQDLFSAFVQDQISLPGRTLLTIGSKLEHNDYTGWEYEPTLRLQRRIGDTHLVWGAVSRAVRMPSRVDRDIRQPSSGPPVLVGGDFESENLLAYEFGFRGRLSSQWVGSVALFYHDYDQLRSIRPTGLTGFPLLVANDLQGESYGLELSLDAWLTDWWRIDGGYTLVRTDLRVRPGRVDINNALNETADPEHQWALGSSMDLPGRVALDSRLRWVDQVRYNNGGQPAWIPSYLELDVRLAVALSEHLELSLAGQNLLEDHHAEAGMAGAVPVEIARSVFARVTWRY